MFAGHVGAGLAIAGAERRVNVGVFIAAALLLDGMLWLLVLLGWEQVAIPADFARTHQPDFVFPYSHGLVASLVWSAIAGAVAFVACARLPAARARVAALVAAAVFSHWLLDALVHRPELPLAGAASTMMGLGLWHSMPLALAVEAAIVGVGLLLFVRGNRLPRGKLLALAALTVIMLVFTVVGMTIAPAPPSAQAMAGSSLATLAVVCVLVCWLGRAPHESSPRRGPL
jgi:hypothetical protein